MTTLPWDDLLPSDSVLPIALLWFSFPSTWLVASGGRGDVLLRIRPNTVLLGDSRGVLPAGFNIEQCHRVMIARRRPEIAS